MYRPLTQNQLAEAMDSRPAPAKAIAASDIQARIADVYHDKVFDSHGVLRMTRCTIELDNGFQVTGESVVVDPLNYVESLGFHFSYQDAFLKLWPYFGFLARENLKTAKSVGVIAETLVKAQALITDYLVPDGVGQAATMTRLVGLLDNKELLEAQLTYAGYEVVRREYGWVAKLPGGGYSEQMPSREEALASACNHFWGKK